MDSSSRPHSSLRAIPPEKVQEIITMRKERKLTGDHIARKLKLHQRTFIRHLIRAKLARQGDIEDRDEDPPRRYEHLAPRDMIHLDIKKLRNFKEEGVRDFSTGNRHRSVDEVAVDDRSFYASVSIMEDETAERVTKHLLEIYQQYTARGILIKRVLTDNGSGYKSKIFSETCQTLNVKHIFTKP